MRAIGNPAFDQAEAVLTALEGGRASLLFSSGMAAATAVFQALAPGDHVLAPRVMYWSLRNWLMRFAAHWGLQGRADRHEPSPDEVRRAIRPGKTRLVWIETPANPLWTITDIALVSDIAHAAGARSRRRFDRRDAGADAAARARRGHRDALRRPST